MNGICYYYLKFFETFSIQKKLQFCIIFWTFGCVCTNYSSDAPYIIMVWGNLVLDTNMPNLIILNIVSKEREREIRHTGANTKQLNWN
jgi:hypothetical protein